MYWPLSLNLKQKYEPNGKWIASIQKAKERGVKFGNKKNLNQQQIVELQNRGHQGVLIKTLLKDYGISKASVYQYLKEENASEQ